MAKFKLVLGTHNAKKVAEMHLLLPADALEVTALSDWAEAIEVAETGSTFTENARLKATEQAIHLQRWVMAEDSGLVVDALAGAPGVYSARFAGPSATDADNNRLLIKRLADVPEADRTARYVAHICLADPQGDVVLETHGHCCGRIVSEPRGAHGFGYDPHFIVPEYHQTFAQLGPAVKKAISHRSRALRAFIPRLLRLIETL